MVKLLPRGTSEYIVTHNLHTIPAQILSAKNLPSEYKSGRQANYVKLREHISQPEIWVFLQICYFSNPVEKKVQKYYSITKVKIDTNTHICGARKKSFLNFPDWNFEFPVENSECLKFKFHFFTLLCPVETINLNHWP